MDLKDKIIKEIEPIFYLNENILSVYLLGSILTGNFNINSDIDIALLMYNEKLFTPLKRAQISNELTYQLGITVDLGIISSKNLIYTSEVLFKGELLLTKDLDLNNLKNSSLLGLYLQFNYERKEILHAYRA